MLRYLLHTALTHTPRCYDVPRWLVILAALSLAWTLLEVILLVVWMALMRWQAYRDRDKWDEDDDRRDWGDDEDDDETRPPQPDRRH